MKQLPLFDVVIAKEEEVEQLIPIKNIKDDDRPSLTADLGPPYGVEKILYPPEVYVNSELNHTQVVTIMRDHQIIPVYIGMDMMFISWEECRLFFKSLLDRHLLEHWGVVATDDGSKEETNNDKEVWVPQEDIQ